MSVKENPQDHKCEVIYISMNGKSKCGKPANGTVGSLTDPNSIMWVCSDCYYDVLKMRSLGQQE